MTALNRKREAVTTGSVVAFSKAAEAIWYEVVRTEGDYGLIVREAGTSCAAWAIHRCYVDQVKAA